MRRRYGEVMTPRTLFRIFANAEMVTWALLLSALLSRAVGGPDFVTIAGGTHGFIFLSYCVTTVFVWVNQRWSAGRGIAGVALAVVPFAPVPFERSLEKRGLLDGPWRLAPGGDTPSGFIEHVQAWILRHPVVSVIILVALVAIVFSVLLYLGPPIPRG